MPGSGCPETIWCQKLAFHQSSPPGTSPTSWTASKEGERLYGQLPPASPDQFTAAVWTVLVCFGILALIFMVARNGLEVFKLMRIKNGDGVTKLELDLKTSEVSNRLDSLERQMNENRTTVADIQRKTQTLDEYVHKSIHDLRDQQQAFINNLTILTKNQERMLDGMDKLTVKSNNLSEVIGRIEDMLQQTNKPARGRG